MPSLSICIPTYNRSTDETSPLIQQYQKEFPSIRYSCNSENLGFDGNIIACVEQAREGYVSFISDDDLVLPWTFRRILDEICIHRSSITHHNHFPFFNNNSDKRLPSFFAQKDRLYRNGKNFFLSCGLGFISSLTIRSDFAKEFVFYAKNGLLGEAHIEIAGRIALLKEGPFLFMGSVSTAARAPLDLGEDYVTCHVLNVDKLYHKLYGEGLLDSEAYNARIKASIKSLLLRNILFNKCLGNNRLLTSQKKKSEIFMGDMRYSIYIYIQSSYSSIPRQASLSSVSFCNSFDQKSPIRSVNHLLSRMTRPFFSFAGHGGDTSMCRE